MKKQRKHLSPTRCLAPSRCGVVGVAALLCGLVLSASAAPIVESRIVDLATGPLGTVGGSEGWTGDSGNYTVTNGSGSLDGTPLGLFAPAGDKVEIASATGLGQLNTYNAFAAADTFPNGEPNNIYYSFLYRFNTLTNLGGDTSNKLVQVNRVGSSSGVHFDLHAITNGSGAAQLGVRKPDGTPAYSPSNILAGQTFFVVLRQQITPGTGNDTIDLWINPSSNSFGAGEFSIPLPDASTTSGTEDGSTGSGAGRFYIMAGVSANLDEFRVSSNSWADVTPALGSCTPAAVDTHPDSVTVSEGISASFSVSSSSSSPLYQWQRSTNTGVSWHNVPAGTGDTSATYSTPPLGTNANQNQYRCIVSVSCAGGSSATSSVATVTVTAATPTPLGVVVDDQFADSSRSNTPITTNNSVWFASSASSLSDGSSGNLVGTPAAGSSRLWIAYFTEDTNQPVHLAVGRAIKATLVFQGSGIVADGGNSMRFGLFDYADGGQRVTGDGFGSGSTGNGINVRGYMLVHNWGTTFSADEPQSLNVRNQLDNSNLMGSTGAYNPMGSGPDGATLTGATAFVDNVDYTLELTVSRTTATETSFRATVTGNGTTNTTVFSDTTYAYPRFDALAIRPNSAETTASSFTISRFKVEVINAPVVAPAPIPLNVSVAGGNATLTWSDPAFKLQAAPEVTGTYTNVPAATSPHVVPASATRQFFRLIWP